MLRLVAGVTFGLLCAQAALAQSYRCTAADGKKYYGSAVPAQCSGVTVEQLSPQGTVVRRIEPQLKAPKGAVKVEAPVSKDLARRDSALLATYASENDIETSRQRALAEHVNAIQGAETKIAALQGQKAPEYELKAQRDFIVQKKRDVDRINARYDAEKQRYRELKKK